MIDAHSTNSSSDDKNEVIQIKYYDMQPVEKDKMIASFKAAVASLAEQNLGASKDPQEFVQKIFDNDAVRDMCIYLS